MAAQDHQKRYCNFRDASALSFLGSGAICVNDLSLAVVRGEADAM
jgi:hypothetical protein